MIYKIRYLPKGRQDLEDIIQYTVDTLKSPKAASDLLDEFDKSISLIKEFPYSHKVYQPVIPLDDEYRVLPVKNFLVFYIVTEDIVEIRRIIYSRMDIDHTIE